MHDFYNKVSQHRVLYWLTKHPVKKSESETDESCEVGEYPAEVYEHRDLTVASGPRGCRNSCLSSPKNQDTSYGNIYESAAQISSIRMQGSKTSSLSQETIIPVTDPRSAVPLLMSDRLMLILQMPQCRRSYPISSIQLVP